MACPEEEEVVVDKEEEEGSIPVGRSVAKKHAKFAPLPPFRLSPSF